MARKVSAETRQDLLQAVRERYRGSLKEEKLRILDEFVAVTGYHRKHVSVVQGGASRQRPGPACASSYLR
jgi:hypothetical protein